jgi:ABC-type dipeptide/oligopeptide/nickel transport system ATPase component
MPLNIQEQANKDLEIENTKNNLDKPLADDLPFPLPNYSGFMMCISGSSGSGKTTALYSIMLKKKMKNKRQSYRKLFDKIYVVSPTIGKASMKKDPFSKLPESQKSCSLSLQCLMELEDEFAENREDNKHSCLILDDVGSQLKKNGVYQKLTQIIQNRRHNFVSIFILVQKFRDVPTGIRNNLSHFITFLPKNNVEKEAIFTELFPFNKKNANDIIEYVYTSKHDFLFVDMSLKASNKFEYYKNFNPLNILEE